MAAPKKGAQKTASKTRRVVGQKQAQVETESTQVPKGGNAPSSVDDAAAAAHESDDDGVVYITATNTGTFQLRAEKSENGRIVEPEWSINFDAYGLARVEEDDETHKAVLAVLAGEWTDDRVSAKQFYENARLAGLGVKAFGLEQAPFSTWDQVEPDQVIPLAVATGALSDVGSIRRALKYEKQSQKRNPPREPREGVVKQLEAILAASEAAPADGPKTVVHATGGNSVGGSAVQVGAAGIGFAAGMTELG